MVYVRREYVEKSIHNNEEFSILITDIPKSKRPRLSLKVKIDRKSENRIKKYFILKKDNYKLLIMMILKVS